MTTNYIDAIDSIFSLIKTAWDSGAGVIVDPDGDPAPVVPALYWPGIQEPDKPDASKYWARISQQTVVEGQTALSGGTGKARFTAQGLIFVQIFCPKTTSKAYENGRLLSVLVKNAFRGKVTTENVWFRNAKIQELSPEISFHRFNVVVEYEYDEMGAL